MDRDERFMKLCALLVSSSLLFSSCSDDVLYLTGRIGFKRENFSCDDIETVNVFAIRDYLTGRDAYVATCVERLAHRLVVDSDAAVSFVDNPSVLLHEYGLGDTKLCNDSMEMSILKMLFEPEALRVLNDGRVGIYVSMLEKRGIPIEKMLEEIKMKQQKWHDGIAEYDSPSFAWLVPVVAVAFLYVGVATIAAVEVAVAADFALKVTGPSLPTKPEDEVKKRESVLREISENMGLTGEQMVEILDMARKNLQLGIGRHY